MQYHAGRDEGIHDCPLAARMLCGRSQTPHPTNNHERRVPARLATPCAQEESNKGEAPLLLARGRMSQDWPDIVQHTANTRSPVPSVLKAPSLVPLQSGAKSEATTMIAKR